MTERKKLEKITIANKFNYILDSYISGTEAQQAFGYDSPSYITRLRDPKHTATLNNLHLQILEHVCNIPQEVFDKKTEFDTVFIDKIINDYTHQEIMKQNHHSSICENLEKNKIFCKNEKLFENLKGIWYGYVYPSNPTSAEQGIWEVETTIHDDYSVVDYWGNAGYLKIGKNESLIIKESYDHDDLTIIRFSNRQIPSEIFRFVIVSNQNHTLHEMVNFGFFSRKKYDFEEAKEILGNIEGKQLKLDIEFNERLIERAIVPQ